MKYAIFKYLLIIIVLSSVLIIKTHPVYAASPDIHGRVVNKFDNSGIAGVFVKWQDHWDIVSGTGKSIRYTQTDADGGFYFRSWHRVNGAEECSNFIDTNLDGVKDSYQARTSNPYYPTNSCSSHAWGCGENGHKWIVVLPSAWRGNFTDTSGNDGIYLAGFNNGGPPIDLGIIYWTPSCNCYSVDIDNIDNLAPDKTVTFITKAKVDSPTSNPGNVVSMIYQIERDGVEITPAPGEVREIPASGPESATVDGKPVSLYITKWDFHIPKEGSGIVTFKVSVQINCETTTAQLPAKRASFLKPLSDYINNHLFGSGIFLTKPVLSVDQTPLADKSLKLGTFYPPEVGKGCDQLWFKINYDSPLSPEVTP